MQKISSYLYPNRINVVADLALFPTRWNIVYQNKIKIYQGVDNVLTIDVKNADQKRIDISEMDLRMIITDLNSLLIADVAVVATATTGLALATITETELADLAPQFLTFSVYIVNEDETKTVLYADTYFGAKGTMELVGTIMDLVTPARYISRFAPIPDSGFSRLATRDVNWYSDAVEITQANFVKSAQLDQINFDFKFVGLTAPVYVQFTKDPVISSSTDWITIETFEVASTTAALSKSYTAASGYNREMRWARIYYTPVRDNTGIIDRIVVTL